MAAKINWQRQGTKLRHCHPMYTVLFGRSELDGNVEELRPKLNAVIAACEGIIDSQSLTQFLGFTLRTGNFINTVTSGRPVAVLRGGGQLPPGAAGGEAQNSLTENIL